MPEDIADPPEPRMRAFGPGTIRFRLSLLFAGVVGVIAVSLFLMVPLALEREALRGANTTAESVGVMAAFNVAPAVLFDDLEGMREALLAALQNEDVLSLDLRAPDGSQLFRLTRSSQDGTTAPREVLSRTFPIVRGDETLGELELTMSLLPVRAEVERSRRIIGSLSVVLFLVGLLVVDLISVHVSRPLAVVANTAERIARGDHSLRAPTGFSGEVGRLARSFNQMLEALVTAQERLLQAQKMESVGQLAGGIAHDFNNLLTTIRGNVDLILFEVDEDGSIGQDLREIKNASTRAAELTGQLLAFSRKQVIRPKLQDLSDIVQGARAMLSRLVGDHIRFETRISETPLTVRLDRSQAEQVLMNLVVNARDAIEICGGILTVRTYRADLGDDDVGDEEQPGPYAVLAVSDTGCGMPADVIERIFEPFFTMKDVGQGTGLGLSTVYGIMQQNGGFIRVYSEVGMGSTFRAFFPLAGAQAAPESSDERADGPLEDRLLVGSETILVVEDQEAVCAMTARVLRRCGYSVLGTISPHSGIEIAKEHPGTIQLLLTDVMMPEMSGPQMAERIKEVRPDISVLFMSGYTDDQLAHHGVLDDGVALLEKPFTAHQLAARVRSLLDEGVGEAEDCGLQLDAGVPG